jgi:hypothetical protein
MRRVRVTHPKGLFIGSGHVPKGAVVEVPDDRRAGQLVSLGHAELVTAVAAGDGHLQSIERATAPPAPEKAARR